MGNPCVYFQLFARFKFYMRLDLSEITEARQEGEHLSSEPCLDITDRFFMVKSTHNS